MEELYRTSSPRARALSQSDVARPGDDRVWAYLALGIASMASLFVLGIMLLKGHLVMEAKAKRDTTMAEFEKNPMPGKSIEEVAQERKDQWAWVERWTPTAAQIEETLGNHMKEGQTIHFFESGTMVMLSESDVGGKPAALDILRNTELSLSDLMVKPTPEGNYLIRYGPKTFFLLFKDTVNEFREEVDSSWQLTLSESAREARKGKPAPPFEVRCALISLYLLERDKKNPRIILSLGNSE